jgi:hypothetical protein
MKPKLTLTNARYQVFWNNMCDQKLKNRFKLALAIVLGRRI